MRFNERKKVLFPQPDGPMSAVIWRARMSNEIASIAVLAP
jgi:hypothetical protein